MTTLSTNVAAIDAEKQRQCRCDDAMLIKSGNGRSGQLLMLSM